MDQIMIEDLSVYAKHGVYTEENVLGQQFLVSVIINIDLAKAGQTDNLEYSIDYGSVCHFVSKYMQQHTYNLIETAAQRLAEELLMQHPAIQKVSIKVKKPWAPIGLPIKNVSAVIERSRHVAYVAFGSNMGDRKAYIQQGIDALNALKTCKVTAVSKTLETVPYGDVIQDNFLNGVLQLDTILSPQQLLEEMQAIEASADRKREIRWGPRTLDLDLLFYDHEIINTPSLTVPHNDLQNRLFVLEPMNELAPWFLHPLLHKTIQQLYDELEQKGSDMGGEVLC